MQAPVDLSERRYTIDEFLAAFEDVEGTAELVDGRVTWLRGPFGHGTDPVCEMAMCAVAKGNAVLALQQAVRQADLPLVALVGGVMIVTGPCRTRVPDGIVLYRDDLDLWADRIERPVLLLEVTSPETRATDLGAKVAEYFALPTVTHYLVVDPEARTATVYRRGSEIVATEVTNGAIILEDVAGATLSLALDTLWEF